MLFLPLTSALGTLTKNEQTVTEAYAVDETIYLDPTSTAPYIGNISPALRKTLEIGALCNNASMVKNEDGVFVGQSTDVAMLNVLELFSVADKRAVSYFECAHFDITKSIGQTFKRLSEKPFNSEQKYMAISGIHIDALTSSLPEKTRTSIILSHKRQWERDVLYQRLN